MQVTETVVEGDVSRGQVALAWGVHLFTASGAVVGVASLLAINSGNPSRAGLLMLLALTIDAVDGAMARAVRVSDALPGIDGRRLDDIIDFLNYVIVAAVFMVAAGNLTHWAWAAVPILASAYGFAQSEAKTEDDFFLGFPSYWNVLALYLWLLEIPPLASTVLVVGLAVLVFVPFKYVYPSRLRILRRTTAVSATLSAALLFVAIAIPDQVRGAHLVEISLLFPVYYFWLSWRLGGLHRK